MPPTDAEIERKLNEISEYQIYKLAAIQKWKSAFILLTQAKLTHEISPLNKDHSEPASLTVNSKLDPQISTKENSVTGTFPSHIVLEAQKAFLESLEAELKCII